jgi:hypothetical protein
MITRHVDRCPVTSQDRYFTSASRMRRTVFAMAASTPIMSNSAECIFVRAPKRFISYVLCKVIMSGLPTTANTSGKRSERTHMQKINAYPQLSAKGCTRVGSKDTTAIALKIGCTVFFLVYNDARHRECSQVRLPAPLFDRIPRVSTKM